jgi:hypothetical protein
MKFLFQLIFIFSFSISFAQAPGHLGKRFVLGYGAHFSPAISNGDARNNTIVGHRTSHEGSATTGQFAYNYTHEAYIEFALSSRFMLGFSGKFYKTVYDNGINISSNSSNYSNNNSNYNIDNNVTGYYTIHGQSLCLYGKLYGKRYVAPWGRYIVFGPVINLYSASCDSTSMYQTSTVSNQYYPYNTISTRNISDFGPSHQSFTGFNIVFGWGRSRIIGKRFTLDYGLNVQLLSILLYDTSQSSTGNFSNSNYIEKTAGFRIRGLNRLNAFIKVGFLIF